MDDPRIKGNGHEIETYYKAPEWSEEEEQAFKYRGNEYFFSQFMAVHNPVHNPNPPEWMRAFDGYMSDSYFSGILIKLIDNGEAVRAYTYIS